MNDFISDNQNVIIALAALGSALAAILSIILTTYSIWSQRRHNRISVAPLGQVSFGDYEDHIHVDIYNEGIGPLVLDELKIFSIENSNTSSELLELMPPMPQAMHWQAFSCPQKGTVITTQSFKRLIGFDVDTSNQAQVDYANSVRKALGSLTIKFTYNDLYGKNQTPCERDLKWFLRNI